jgi:hypothetical protein
VVSSILLCGCIVYSIFVVIIFVDIFRYLTIGIRALSLAEEGKNFLLFLKNFSREEKEGGTLHVHI